MEKYGLRLLNNKNIPYLYFGHFKGGVWGPALAPGNHRHWPRTVQGGGRGRLWQRPSDGPVLQCDVSGAFGALLQTTQSQAHRSMGETDAQRQVQRSSRGGYATTEGCERGERKLLLFLVWEKRFMYISLIAVDALEGKQRSFMLMIKVKVFYIGSITRSSGFRLC